jgi:hypothetical protein
MQRSIPLDGSGCKRFRLAGFETNGDHPRNAGELMGDLPRTMHTHSFR